MSDSNCEKMTKALVDFDSSGELEAFDSIFSDPAKKQEAKAILIKRLNLMQETLLDLNVDQYKFWKKYKDGEVVAEIDAQKDSFPGYSSFYPSRNGFIIVSKSQVYENGKLVVDFSDQLRDSGYPNIVFSPHPWGYMVMAGRHLWINKKEYPIRDDGWYTILPHPKGFIRYQHSATNDIPEGFYLNDKQPIHIERSHGDVGNTCWSDRQGNIYTITLEGDVENPFLCLRKNGENVPVPPIQVESKVSSAFYAHPDGFMVSRGGKLYLNDETLLYKGMALSQVERFPYPGGVIIRKGLGKDRYRFIFYDGSSFPENKPKKSLFHNFLNRDQK
jgi:hypothetical protein